MRHARTHARTAAAPAARADCTVRLPCGMPDVVPVQVADLSLGLEQPDNDHRDPQARAGRPHRPYRDLRVPAPVVGAEVPAAQEPRPCARSGSLPRGPRPLRHPADRDAARPQPELSRPNFVPLAAARARPPSRSARTGDPARSLRAALEQDAGPLFLRQLLGLLPAASHGRARQQRRQQLCAQQEQGTRGAA